MDSDGRPNPLLNPLLLKNNLVVKNYGVAYRPPKSISSFMAGFKSSATKRINEYRQTPRKPVWQSKFHDRIIRNAGEYRRISRYIEHNPAKWEYDHPETWFLQCVNLRKFITFSPNISQTKELISVNGLLMPPRGYTCLPVHSGRHWTTAYIKIWMKEKRLTKVRRFSSPDRNRTYI